MACASDFVTFAGGLTLPIAVWLLALDLESRGVQMAVDGDQLVVSPRELVTEADIAQIRRWKSHLIAVVQYQAPTPSWMQ